MVRDKPLFKIDSSQKNKINQLEDIQYENMSPANIIQSGSSESTDKMNNEVSKKLLLRKNTISKTDVTDIEDESRVVHTQKVIQKKSKAPLRIASNNTVEIFHNKLADSSEIQTPATLVKSSTKNIPKGGKLVIKDKPYSHKLRSANKKEVQNMLGMLGGVSLLSGSNINHKLLNENNHFSELRLKQQKLYR